MSPALNQFRGDYYDLETLPIVRNGYLSKTAKAFFVRQMLRRRGKAISYGRETKADNIERYNLR